MLEKIISIFVRIYKCGLTIAQRSVKMENIETQQVKHRFGIIGNSNVLNRAIEIAIQVAKTDLSVLITGESGVGKENIAQIIHQYSARKHNNYIAVNCGAIPKGTMESELFGHEKGAFTSAIKSRSGKFEQANGGTIFLDEIGDMSLSAQAKVLRCLQENVISPVGSDKDIKIDVRVIAATNKNLKEEIEKGNFREDLYHRLSVILINVPALDERKEDIPLLIKHFAKQICDEYGSAVKTFDDKAIKKLQERAWTGNIRELRNVVERLIILGGQKITVENVESFVN